MSLYKNSDILVFGKNKISIDLKGFNVAIDLGDNVAIDTEVKIVIELFSIDEIRRLDMLSRESLNELSIEICKEKILDVISKYGKMINFDFSGAGLAYFIVSCIYHKTKELLSSFMEVYTAYAENILVIEQMAAIIARNMTISYQEVIRYPVTEILRLHAICAASFPDVVDLRPKEEDLTAK